MFLNHIGDCLMERAISVGTLAHHDSKAIFSAGSLVNWNGKSLNGKSFLHMQSKSLNSRYIIAGNYAEFWEPTFQNSRKWQRKLNVFCEYLTWINLNLWGKADRARNGALAQTALQEAKIPNKLHMTSNYWHRKFQKYWKIDKRNERAWLQSWLSFIWGDFVVNIFRRSINRKIICRVIDEKYTYVSRARWFIKRITKIPHYLFPKCSLCYTNTMLSFRLQFSVLNLVNSLALLYFYKFLMVK